MSDKLDPEPGRPSDEEPPPVELPRWVPVLIALVLVLIAGFAVYTGMRFHGGRVSNSVQPATTTTMRQESGAPGEPQPGASRILPGDSAENPPQPSTAQFEQQSRIRIEGGKSGLAASYRAAVRRGIQLRVKPAEAILYVNDQPIAPVRQFEGPDEVYEFPEAGNFTIRISAPGFRDAVYLISADPNAKDEVGLIEMQMEKAR